jgi:outer membrane translocation and assembly module TamA
MALWPGASAGRGRGVLLRAHPLHSHGIVTSEVFGRRIAYASVERQHIVKTLRMATIGVAGFVDAAQVWRRGAGLESSPLHVDIGGGLRINAPKTGGMVRVDLGYGLRDGDVQLSAGWMGSWPRR